MVLGFAEWTFVSEVFGKTGGGALGAIGAIGALGKKPGGVPGGVPVSSGNGTPTTYGGEGGGS